MLCSIAVPAFADEAETPEAVAEEAIETLSVENFLDPADAEIIIPDGSYAITVSNDGNGTVTASHPYAEPGTSVTLTPCPDAGFLFDRWQVIKGGVTVTANQFFMGSQEVEIRAVFKEDPDYYRVPARKDPNAVARIYLCSKTNPFPKVSHVFIYVENLTDNPIKVGQITLEKDQGVSMGAFGLQRSDGWGVYYNTESYRFQQTDYDSIRALVKELKPAQLNKLNDYLISYNHWDLFINCVFFATNAWNSCTGSFIFPIFIPIFMRFIISINPNRVLLPAMYVPPRDQVYYVVGIGKNQRLVICSDKSVER